MTDFDRARILVLGDSGVGKSSLVHLIARGKPLSHITYTIGASNEVKLHEYKEGTPSQRTYWIGQAPFSWHKFGRNSSRISFFFQLVWQLFEPKT